MTSLSSSPARATGRADAVTRRPGHRGRWWKEVGWKYPVAVVIVFYAAFPLVYALSAALSSRGSLAGSSSLFSCSAAWW